MNSNHIYGYATTANTALVQPTFSTVQAMSLPAAGPESPLDWLDRRVREITQL